MSPSLRTPTVWAGHWMMAVAGLHTVVGAIVFTDPLLDIARRGVFDSIQRDPSRGVAFWFMMFGAVIAVLAPPLTAIERRGELRVLRATGLGMLLTALLGVLMIPVSGFWLAFPPAIGLLMKRGNGPAEAPLRAGAAG